MRRLLLVALVILIATVQGMAQADITVTAKVTDEKGASIAGDTITEKGSRNATTSRDDGPFTIKVKNKAKLVISYIGYEPFEADAKEGLKVSLSHDTKSVSDIAVTVS